MEKSADPVDQGAGPGNPANGDAESPHGSAFDRLRSTFRSRHIVASILFTAGALFVLHLMGRQWYCAAGDLRIWSSEILSEHNSQHLFDPYTFTHVLHGIGFYAILWLLLGRWTSVAVRGVATVALESLWEILENTPTVIERYREGTLALGYYGDSVVNSFGDILACAAGYLVAFLVPAWASLALFLGLEAFLVLWIRDSLLLNIIMLLHPVEWIKNWQSSV